MAEVYITTKSKFDVEIQKSSLHGKFSSVQTLIDEIGALVEELREEGYKVSIGLVENFDFKYDDGNVIARFEYYQRGRNVTLSNDMQGRAGTYSEKHKFYDKVMKLYSDYRKIRFNGAVVDSESRYYYLEDAKDVDNLIKILRMFVVRNPYEVNPPVVESKIRKIAINRLK